MTKREQASLYRKAANLIQKHGWVQGTFQKGEKLCAVGGFRVAATGSSSTPTPGIRNTVAERQVLGMGLLVEFNDRPTRTQKEVVRALRRIARHLEHGGG